MAEAVLRGHAARLGLSQVASAGVWASSRGQDADRRAVQADARPRRVLDEDGPIPNPLQQTYDKRFVKPVKAGAGSGSGTGSGRGRKKPASSKGGAAGAGQPDPMRTSVGYIGADAFHQKGKAGRGGKGGRRR